jgi:pyridoxamine 5'-phosphate oxidase
MISPRLPAISLLDICTPRTSKIGSQALGESVQGGKLRGTMSDRGGIFAGDDPFALARRWLAEAEAHEPNDPNAIALATVDASGMPNVRMVLLKEIEADAFVFYTNYGSVKAVEIDAAGKAAFVLHWKSLRRQIRVRGLTTREEGPQADAYFASRSLKSRLGAWASAQSQPLASRAALLAEVARVTAQHGVAPKRPPFWGGFRLVPLEIEFWADGAFRLHDRFRWQRQAVAEPWAVTRLSP